MAETPIKDAAKEKFVQNYIANNPDIDPKLANERALTEFDTMYSFETDQAQGTYDAGKIETGTYNNIDYTKVANKYNVDPKQLGGLLGRMGAGALDPVSEALEVALGKIGLGKVAKGWVQGEVLNLMAGALRGLAQGSGEYLAQTTGPAVMNLSAGKQVVQGSETPGVDALISGLEGFADQMEYSPSYIIDEKVKEKTGKYGGEHLRAAASRLGNTITK